MGVDIILELCDISKSFPGVQALAGVSLAVRRGEVHAVVGENGAGKSTLMKITAGLYQPDHGKVLLSGQAVQIQDAQDALRLGIAMVPQELNLVPEMSVAENILLGMEPRHALGSVDVQQLHRKAAEILATLGLGTDTHERVKRLSVAQQQIVQIARATAHRCSVLIMDEPTASLSHRETQTLFDNIRRFKESGKTIIYISHRLEEVFEIADRITVLRDGKLMATLDRSGATQDQIVHLMIGRSLSEFLHEREERKRGGDIVLETRGLRRDGVFEDISFALHRGEILGFAGLVGSGRTDLFTSLIGFAPHDAGEVLLEGRPVKIDSPSDAIRLSIGYLPEERKRLGLFLMMSVLHNISIPFLRRLQRLSVLELKEERIEAAKLSQQLNIRTPSLSRQVRYLSGGNQQKVILARWLGSGANILILDEPTRGIDVNAKAEIHALIADLAAQNKSIIMISSELQELMAIADRVIIMRGGRIVGEVYPKDVTQEDVLRVAMRGSAGDSPVTSTLASVDTPENSCPPAE